MAKANINLPNGTHIVIEGNVEEVSNIVKLIKGQLTSARMERDKEVKGALPEKKKLKPGLTAYVLELKEEGYFKKERVLEDILNALEQKGHIYPTTSLSELMLRLTRQKKLGRIKKDNIWVYVHRE